MSAQFGRHKFNFEIYGQVGSSEQTKILRWVLGGLWPQQQDAFQVEYDGCGIELYLYGESYSSAATICKRLDEMAIEHEVTHHEDWGDGGPATVVVTIGEDQFHALAMRSLMAKVSAQTPAAP